MLRQLARRAPVTRAGTLMRRSPLSTTPPAEKSGSFLNRYPFDDWKLTMPFGIFLAIPIIHNEVLILSEETQLVGCFALFCGLFYNAAAEPLAEMLEKRRTDILAKHNAQEEEAIDAARSIKEAEEKNIAILSHLPGLVAMRKDVEIQLHQAKAMELKHMMRDDAVKQLDTLVAKEDQIAAIVSSKMVKDAVSAVTAEFEKPEVKDAALKEAIAVIAKPGDKQATLVTSLFKTFFDQKKEKAIADKGKVVDLSPEFIAEMREELDALMKRDGIEGIHVDVPTKITL